MGFNMVFLTFHRLIEFNFRKKSFLKEMKGDNFYEGDSNP